MHLLEISTRSNDERVSTDLRCRIEVVSPIAFAVLTRKPTGALYPGRGTAVERFGRRSQRIPSAVREDVAIDVGRPRTASLRYQREVLRSDQDEMAMSSMLRQRDVTSPAGLYRTVGMTSASRSAFTDEPCCSFAAAGGSTGVIGSVWGVPS